MKAIRFGKLKNSTIIDIISMISENTNPNSKVYITTERPAKHPSDYTVEELTEMLAEAKHSKLVEKAALLERDNPELYQFIKEKSICEHYQECYEDRNDVY
jgi:hypothetical protein